MKKETPLKLLDVLVIAILAALVVLCAGSPDLLDAIIARVGAA